MESCCFLRAKYFCFGVGELRATLKLLTGLQSYKKYISKLAVRKRNYTASLCGLGGTVKCSKCRVTRCFGEDSPLSVFQSGRQ